MGTLAKLVSSLSQTTDRIIESLGTDSFYVLRVIKSADGRGGSTKEYEPTTADAYPCFYAPLPQTNEQREEMRATKHAPVVYFRFVSQSSVDVRPDDKLRLVARAPLGEKEFQIVRVADPIGITREVIAIEEVPVTE